MHKSIKTLFVASIALLSVNCAFADSQPVKVTNTNANPVPVNGNVVVSGTANVNVTNPVTIANPVSTVTVGNATPIPVAVTGTIPVPIVENPARSAVDYSDDILLYPGMSDTTFNLDFSFITTKEY